MSSIPVWRMDPRGTCHLYYHEDGKLTVTVCGLLVTHTSTPQQLLDSNGPYLLCMECENHANRTYNQVRIRELM